MTRFLFLAALLVLGACEPQGKADIAILNNSPSNPYWKTLSEGIKDTSKALKRPVFMQTLTKADDAEEQANQCENALLRQPKAIIFASANRINLIPCFKKANAQGILLVDVDGGFTQQDAARNKVKVAFSVASDNVALGQQAADYLRAKKIKGAALILEGPSGNNNSIRRIKGFKNHKPAGLKIVASLSADWDRLKAANVTNDVLTAHPDLKVVFAANDQMALGAAETLLSQGRRDVIVIGIDGTKDAVKAIKEGRMTASVAQLPYLMAKQALEKTVAYLDKPAPVPFQQYVPILTLDKDMLDQGTDPLLAYVR